MLSGVKQFLQKHDTIKDIYNLEGKTNVEHLVPKSCFYQGMYKFNKDLHFIYNANMKMNNWRSNYTFEDLSEGTPYFNNKKVLKNDGAQKFCPPAPSKGLIARSCAYFLYKNPCMKKHFHRVINPECLLNWHIEWPVEVDEYHRNCQVCMVQGDRNIFIDQPDLLAPFICEHFTISHPMSIKGFNQDLRRKLSLYWE